MPTITELLPLCETTLGWVLGCSRRGSLHQRAGTLCQDAYAVWSGTVAGNPCLAMAVADGHGHQEHDLSHYGASLAVQAATQELRAFYHHFGLDGSPYLLKYNFKSHFPRRVARRWREMVLQDAKEQLSEGVPNPDDHSFLTRYGTTLLTALITSDTILLGQIGDGQLLLVSPDEPPLTPFKEHERLLGSDTYSLALPDCHQYWQTIGLERQAGSLVVLATDGLTDAVGGNLADFATKLLESIQQHGLERVAASLPHWLDAYSKGGSGDDATITLALINS